MKSKFLSRTLQALCSLSQTTFLPSFPPTHLTLSQPKFPNTAHTSFMSPYFPALMFPHLSHPFASNCHLFHRSKPCSSYFSLWNSLWSFQSKSVSPFLWVNVQKFQLVQELQRILPGARNYTKLFTRYSPPKSRGFLTHLPYRTRFKVEFFQLLTSPVTLGRYLNTLSLNFIILDLESFYNPPKMTPTVMTDVRTQHEKCLAQCRPPNMHPNDSCCH